MKECYTCGFNDEDYGCTCPHADKWYACPIENKKPENIQKFKEYAEWLPQYEGKWVVEIEKTETIKCHGKQITVPKGTFEKIMNEEEADDV